MTVTSIVFEALPLATLGLASDGAVNVSKMGDYEFDAAQNGPLVIRPGELLVVRNPVAMDAAGVWNLTFHVEWYEAIAP